MLDTPDTELTKITVQVPKSLLAGLVDGTHGNLSAVVREALRAYRHKRALTAMMELRAQKIALSIDPDDSRCDKDAQ